MTERPDLLGLLGKAVDAARAERRPDPAEEFEALRRIGPKLGRAQWARMKELERILDARDRQPGA